MLILAIETTGKLASAALLKGSQVCEAVNHTDYSHLQEIVPMIDRLLKENSIVPAQLDAIAVSRGPGSFTGVRIGMATAKGLAQVWNKPVIEVPTLASFAFGVYDWLPQGERLLFCPLFDARRNQVYSGVYEPLNGSAVIEDRAVDADEQMADLKTFFTTCHYDRVVFFGDGIKPCLEKLEALGIPYLLALEEDRYQKASSAARLAARLYEAGDVKDCYTCAPEYLRQAEAERKLKEKC
ncbi:MAG: tRNA (adenosine(37)-N6)-threonylcarbamoyltransferase complex dimerization subunit type 1 TsaB [Firmicutes bacterium]|nr:tRNA (adenosine(37)-N6)-threonylcarbamoyltransferase complex dimerization subunit type 1 TsaB [Bacillota bacterium]